MIRAVLPIPVAKTIPMTLNFVMSDFSFGTVFVADVSDPSVFG